MMLFDMETGRSNGLPEVTDFSSLSSSFFVFLFDIFKPTMAGLESEPLLLEK